MQVSRRELGVVLATPATALAQTVPEKPAAADAELQAAREQARRNSQALAHFDLPMATEPACTFKP